ncbi:MAG: PAS domain S-box protein [Chloroflexi bacterium]|nr:PAS domain S-box protein [Chloroflexota bacterium]
MDTVHNGQLKNLKNLASSLRFRLFLLVLLAILPASAVVTYTGLRARSEDLPWDLSVLFLGALVAFGATWAVTTRWVLRPLSRMVDATRRLAAGDLEARTGLAAERGEIGQLAQAFDEMSDRLRQRQVEAGQSKALLEASEAKYRGLYDSLKDGVLMTDVSGRILECNQGFLDMLGYKKEEITGLTNQDITPLKWRRIDGGMIKYQVRPKGYSGEYEKEYIARDGRVIPVVARVWSINDGRGGLKALWGIMRDISERKQAEEEMKTALRFLEIANQRKGLASLLREFAEETKRLTACDSVGIRLLDESGRIPYAAHVGFSRAFCESESHLSINMDRCLCINVIKGAANSSLPFYTAHGSFYSNRTTGLRSVPEEVKGKTREVCNTMGYESVALVPLRLGDRIIGLIHVADHKENMVPLPLVKQLEQAAATVGVCIERALAEEELGRNVERLQAANKELEAFTYSVSHDLRAPLRAINGFSQVVMEDYGGKLDDTGKRYLHTIVSSANKMGQLINDLLAFSRLGRAALNSESIDMDSLVRDVCREAEREAAGRCMEFVVGSLPPAQGDPTMVRQAVVNLVSNAVKFTRPREKAHIEIGARVESGENTYYIKDNGVGFDMEYYGKLFGVFQRLHREEEFEGTGVGLAIVQRIIQRHGGRVWAESKPDAGATFSFALPREPG